jgi:hypothetical protein
MKFCAGWLNFTLFPLLKKNSCSSGIGEEDD